MKDILHVGDHYLVELNECDINAINSESILREALLKGIAESGAVIIKDVFHSFSPHGVTGVVVIAESHVSIHTWPEHGYAAVDIFTCKSSMKIESILEHLRSATHCKSMTSKKVLRGPDLQSAHSPRDPALA